MINQNIVKIISFTGYGFASGLPYVLIFITLTAWLRDVGVDLSLIGFISWIMLTYSLKFLWAPFVDRSSSFLFKRFGHRRSWIITMQLLIIVSLIILSFINPLTNLTIFALFAFNVALAGSIQDIAIDAYRIESAHIEDQGNLAAGYQFGYRIAILIGSSLALIYADNFSWLLTYQLMAVLMLINLVVTVYISSENPNSNLVKLSYKQSLIDPTKDFFERFGIKIASMLLLVVATYRLTDIVMGPMANPFYIDMGYSLSEIGYVVKVVALIATLIGVFVGGIFIKQYGLYKSLLIGAFLVMLTNLCFSYASISDKNLIVLACIVASDSLAAGIVGTVNITFLTSLVSSKYTRLPVFKDTIDNIVGILHLKDSHSFLENFDKKNENDFKKILQKTYFVSQSTLLMKQLKEFLANNEALGFVVDEYGEIEGLVSVEDIFIEITGKFGGDKKELEKEFIKLKDGSILTDGNSKIRDLNNYLNWKIPEDSSKTINGLVTEYLDQIPQANLCIEIENYRFEILEFEDNLISKIKIKKSN